ncbi:hypothetical protein [Chitinophaga qingshengii]|uniref:Uncharacterized protein n=1 Tax=Chitinophaga qingshengii TaxID=1569794 RepID=A0ABR7TR23_9BACT|nr:hypothetical protein [Chitinophaga qingshengii]MBC9932930.1 hypothetical protein [Chitinophaga qingshengii]
MKRKQAIHLDFEIDKLTNSIQNVITEDSFPTDVLPVTKEDLKTITKKNGWQFDWKNEFKQPAREIYKLTIVNNITIIQGLVSLEVKSDHIYMHLIESAPFNKGKTKVYAGVPGNLVAFVCRVAFRRGFEGTVSFLSKTQLIEHYIESLDAVHIGGQRMIIETKAALKLIDKYFKN